MQKKIVNAIDMLSAEKFQAWNNLKIENSEVLFVLLLQKNLFTEEKCWNILSCKATLGHILGLFGLFKGVSLKAWAIT